MQLFLQSVLFKSMLSHDDRSLTAEK